MAKIDRDAAIAVMFRRYHEAAKSWNERGKDADYGAMVALDRAGNELAKLPAEEDRPAFRWIPCEEALPEERRAVLVYAPLRKSIYMAYYDSAYGWMTFDPIFPEPFPVSVGVIAAWMKPPEPYEEEQQDEQGAG